MRVFVGLIIIYESNCYFVDCIIYITFLNYEFYEYIYVCVFNIIFDNIIYLSLYY